MKKIFIDCGTNWGQALDDFNKSHRIMDGTWDVYLFEPNPNLSGKINHHIVNKFPQLNIKFYQSAVVGANAPAEMKFMLHKQPEHKAAFGGGSTLITDDKFHEQELEGYEEVVVKTQRLTDFIMSVAEPFIEIRNGNVGHLDRSRCAIVVKLDVEGAEYEIMHDLINTGVAWWIQEVHVEFHGRRFKEDKRQEEVTLVGELFQHGVHCFHRK